MQTYFAKSVFNSRTLWFNVASFVIAISELTEVTSIIPDDWRPGLAALVAMINVALRLYSVRPVAFVSPGDTKSVSVESLPISK